MRENTNADKRCLMDKLIAAKTALIMNSPFFGRLLMHLKYGFAECGTACTDMQRILFDPMFLSRITTEEVEFVLLHEVMHCVLDHCRRSRGKNRMLYNIATDIVVNSTILQIFGCSDFSVDGATVMHLAPDGNEGHLYTADQVYEMLCKKYQKTIEDLEKLKAELLDKYGVELDTHAIWEVIPLTQVLSEEWKTYVKEAAKKASEEHDLPSRVRKLLNSDEYNPKFNWRHILHDFIQVIADDFDYTFSPSDHRFSEIEFILPSFHEMEGEMIENLWLLIDVSGSIDDQTLSEVFREIEASMNQFDCMEMRVSCFDTNVTDPKKVECIDDLRKLQLSGGGGTRFSAIFDYLSQNMMNELPAIIVIITDGYSHYPEESVTMGIPVLWILVDNEVDAPWGKTAHVQL